MNIFVITKSQWSDTIASGNTYSNFFSDWKDAHFFNLYLREDLPQNNVCNDYFNITEKQILKNIMKPSKIGRTFSKDKLPEIRENIENIKSINQEIKIVNHFRSSNKTILLIAIELLWKFGGWKNKKLNTFLDQKIDIIFAAAASPIYLQRIVRYCVKKTGAKLVLFFGDDTYCYMNRKPLQYLYKASIRRAIRESVKKSSKLYGTSQKLCDEYERYFGKKIEPLYKGCTFDKNMIKTTVSTPVKIVYAGNLLYGRWKTLGALAEEIEKINDNVIKITLEIYTTASVTLEIDRALNRGLSSKIIGAKPYEEIKTILADADLVLQVESFEKEAIEKTRLSFSTKIIDCMQSGSCMMAIGPDCVASIEYLDGLEGAIVIKDMNKMGETIRGILRNPEMIINNAKQLKDYARQHHNIECVRNSLRNDFEALLIKRNP